jgi:hypothetical protein
MFYIDKVLLALGLTAEGLGLVLTCKTCSSSTCAHLMSLQRICQTVQNHLIYLQKCPDLFVQVHATVGCSPESRTLGSDMIAGMCGNELHANRKLSVTFGGGGLSDD